MNIFTKMGLICCVVALFLCIPLVVGLAQTTKAPEKTPPKEETKAVAAEKGLQHKVNVQQLQLLQAQLEAKYNEYVKKAEIQYSADPDVKKLQDQYTNLNQSALKYQEDILKAAGVATSDGWFIDITSDPIVIKHKVPEQKQ